MARWCELRGENHSPFVYCKHVPFDKLNIGGFFGVDVPVDGFVLAGLACETDGLGFACDFNGWGFTVGPLSRLDHVG